MAPVMTEMVFQDWLALVHPSVLKKKQLKTYVPLGFKTALFTQNMSHCITNEEAWTLEINEWLKLRLRSTQGVNG